MKLQTNELFKQELSRDSSVHRLTNEEVAEIQHTLLDMAKDITDLCDREGIPYVLGGGSCLGAVRHHGFIPWDDDLDINMLRADADRFSRLVEKEYNDKYEMIVPVRSEGYDSTFLRVQKKGTVFREYEYQQERYCGLKIDIFLYENTYSSPLKRKLHGFLCDGGSLLLSCIRMHLHRDEFLALAGGKESDAAKAVKLKSALGALPSLSPRFWYKAVNRWFAMDKDDSSEYVTCPSGRRHFFGELQKRDAYWNKRKKIPFEDTSFYVAGNTEEYLTGLDGPDYMTLPPEEKREHHIIREIRL